MTRRKIKREGKRRQGKGESERKGESVVSQRKHGREVEINRRSSRVRRRQSERERAQEKT